MPEFDLIIRGGTIVDGTRLPRYGADIAIKDGRVAQIGGLRNAGAGDVLDASGLVVAPGFVDLHTHYDAQIQWDPYCTISGWHGVTSVVLGNCGFGFAPVKPELRDRAMLMMTRNEAIPYDSMREGMRWDWETFPEWLDSLERIPKGVNCVSYVAVSPLLVWAMGLEAAKSRPATAAERAEMQRLLDEALTAGACGWSVQRLGARSLQADYDGTPMPTDMMSDEDILALAEVLHERDFGFIQITQASGGNPAQQEEGDTDYDLLFQETLAKVSGRPVLHNVIAALDDAPEFHRSRMQWLDSCLKRGLKMYGQSNNVRTWFIVNLEHWNLYDSSPAWNEATQGSKEERKSKLSDASIRERMKAEDGKLITVGIGGPIQGLIVNDVAGHPDLGRYVGRTLGDIANEEGRHHIDVMLDIAVATDLAAEFRTPDATSANPDLVAELMLHPQTIPGVSDGGAHTKFFTGGSYTTDFLTWLVRDTERVSLEDAHYKLSYLPAQAAGFKDRGFLREGAPADVVVYDLEQLKRSPEFDYEIAHDFPGGEWRRVQRAEGYRWILVNGEITFENGKCTGATPGRLLRGGRG